MTTIFTISPEETKPHILSAVPNRFITVKRYRPPPNSTFNAYGLSRNASVV